MHQKQSTPESMDFSPLIIKKGAWWLELGVEDSLRIFFVCAVGIAIILLISPKIAEWILGFALVGIIIMSGFIGDKRGNPKAQALRKFAVINGFIYKGYGSKDWGPGTLFTHGHDKHMKYVVGGTFYNLPFQLYEYEYTQGSGNYERDYDATVFVLKLPRRLPHMVIDSLVEADNFSLSTLPITFKQSQRIVLEGDFSQYFALYAPDTFAVTALTVLAPDVMETVMRCASLCDVEIIKDRIYFYWPDTKVNPESIENKFATVQAVLDKTYQKLTKSDIFARQSQARLVTEPGKGVRLKQFSWKPYVVMASGLYIILKILGVLLPNLPDLFDLAFFVFIGLIAWKLYRRKQLKDRLHRRFQGSTHLKVLRK